MASCVIQTWLFLHLCRDNFQRLLFWNKGIDPSQALYIQVDLNTTKCVCVYVCGLQCRLSCFIATGPPQLSPDRGHEPVLLSATSMFLQERSRNRNPHLPQSCRLSTIVASDSWDKHWRWSDLWVYIPQEKRKCCYFYHEGVLSFWRDMMDNIFMIETILYLSASSWKCL